MINPIIAYELFAILSAIPLVFLFRRAGLKPWPTLFVFVPLIGFCIAGSALAFPRWPVLPERKGKKVSEK